MKKILLLLLGISSINVFAENTDFNTETINKEAQYLKIVNQKGKLIVIKGYEDTNNVILFNKCFIPANGTKNSLDNNSGGYPLAAGSSISFRLKPNCTSEILYTVGDSLLGYNPESIITDRSTSKFVEKHSKINISKSLEGENGSVITVGNSGK